MQTASLPTECQMAEAWRLSCRANYPTGSRPWDWWRPHKSSLGIVGIPSRCPRWHFTARPTSLPPTWAIHRPIAPKPFANIPDWAAHVAQRNQCKGGPTNTRISPSVRRLAYTNCAENADVILYTIEGGGHTWPGGKHLAEWIAGRTTDEINASTVIWEFFVQHPLGPK